MKKIVLALAITLILFSGCVLTEPMTRVFKLEDDSVCPCKGGSLVINEECSELVASILAQGYDEVEFCDGGN